MRAYNLVGDLRTGEQFAVDKLGNRVPMATVEQLIADEQRGDVAATVALRRFDLNVDEQGRAVSPQEIEALLQHVMDDCPDCQAARARGETPRVLAGQDLERAMSGAERLGFEAWLAGRGGFRAPPRRDDRPHQRRRGRRRR